MNDENTPKDKFKEVYSNVAFYLDDIMNEYDIFPNILAMMNDGNATIELKKRYLLRAIDQAWIEAIEDTLPSLDIIIRNPTKYIEENEEVLPIEMAKNISVRSLQHLAQHTNYISRIEGDEIIPSKILNVFRDETMMTYENKFVNTLINRLFSFVNRRYEIAKKSGQDVKTSSVEFKDEFIHNDAKVKMNFKIEIEENAQDDEKVERNYTYSSALWKRVEKLNEVLITYINSSFCLAMGKSFIRPPVMRTNAILKNKDLRKCLELWRFIEGYDGAGYSMIVQENLEDIDEDYIKELSQTFALQYLIFRQNIKNEFEEDNTLASEVTDNVLKPRIINELNGIDEAEYDYKEERKIESLERIRYRQITPEDELILKDIDIALEAARIIRENDEEHLYSNASIIDPGLLDSSDE